MLRALGAADLPNPAPPLSLSHSRSLIARHPRSVHDTVTNVDVTVLNLNGSEPSDGTGACAELETGETPGTISIITEQETTSSVTVVRASTVHQ